MAFELNQKGPVGIEHRENSTSRKERKQPVQRAGAGINCYSRSRGGQMKLEYKARVMEEDLKGRKSIIESKRFSI